MINKNLRRSIFSVLLPLGLVFFLCSQWDSIPAHKTSSTQASEEAKKKQKGVHFFGKIDSTSLQHLSQNNMEWITLVAWSSQEDFDSPMVQHHYGDSLKLERRNIEWYNRIERAHAAGFKVFVKPHIWIENPSNGTWRSDISPTTEDNWKLWKEAYRDFIIRYANIAEAGKAEMFCIGTEFSRLSVEKPLFWQNLIQEVRGIYTGKITYAANWYEEYENIIFWEDLDYIGIQAYFPLVANHHPSIQQISEGWDKYIPTLKRLHKKHNRQILFTEMGYKSTADSAIEPWRWMEHRDQDKQSISLETQANCFQAFFDTIWEKKWFAGVHIWQMRDYANSGGLDNLDFTPQNKPAEDIITKGFE